MTEGLDFYPIPHVWRKGEVYATVDDGAIRIVAGEPFYMVSGELLSKLLTLAGFEPEGEA